MRNYRARVGRARLTLRVLTDLQHVLGSSGLRSGTWCSAYAERFVARPASRVACCNRCFPATVLLLLVCVRRDDTFAAQRGDEGARQVTVLHSVSFLIELPVIVRVWHD